MPSNSVLEQKKVVVADLVEKIKKAQSGVLVQYQGITVDNDTKMRAAFRKAGVDYMVIKNTLIGRACDEVGYGAIKSQLNGMSATRIRLLPLRSLRSTQIRLLPLKLRVVSLITL